MRPELWLPVEFDHLIRTSDIAGSTYWIGSSSRFLQELETLNSRTLKASDETLAEWAKDGPPEDDLSLQRMARFGLGLFMQAARYSVENRVPLKLDY
jgi:hypothetical protein